MTREERIEITKDSSSIKCSLPIIHKYNKNNRKTNIEVVNADCLIIAEGFDDPFVLINASPTRPGGGVWTGARAQEEDVFRRSSLCQITNDLQKYYPLNNSAEGIYIEDVTVFKDAEENNFELLGKEFTISAFIMPALNLSNPKVEFSYKDTENRIDTILSAALYYGHTDLILGAFGCGVFKNDPLIIASIFSKLLNTKYKNLFDNVVFAVLSKHDNNYKTFKKILENE